MQTVIDTEEIHANFRLWITTEKNLQFPIGLLQMSLKFTNEPPQGIRASLKRTYANIQQDTIDYSNHPTWPSLLFAVAWRCCCPVLSLCLYHFLFIDIYLKDNF